MLTTILCLLFCIALYIAWCETDDWREWFGLVIGLLVFSFGILFPVLYGEHVSESADAVKIYEVKQIDGNYYCFNDGEWVDILKINGFMCQSDNLSIVEYKNSGSLWYYRIPVRKVNIPIVLQK